MLWLLLLLYDVEVVLPYCLVLLCLVGEGSAEGRAAAGHVGAAEVAV